MSLRDRKDNDDKEGAVIRSMLLDDGSTDRPSGVRKGGPSVVASYKSNGSHKSHASKSADETMVEITIGEFINVPTFKQQSNSKGEALIDDSRVADMTKDVATFLKYLSVSKGTGSPVVLGWIVGADWVQVLSGNHRQAAARILVEQGLLSENYKFNVLLVENLSPQAAMEHAYNNNHSNNKTNEKQQRINNRSKMSICVLQPIYKALLEVVRAEKLSKTFSRSWVETVTIRSGCYFDSLGETTFSLLEGTYTQTEGEVYEAKKHPAHKAGPLVLSWQPSIDLRGMHSILVEFFTKPLVMFHDVVRSAAWETRISGGNNRNKPKALLWFLLNVPQDALDIEHKNKRVNHTLTLKSFVDSITNKKTAKKFGEHIANHAISSNFHEIELRKILGIL